MIGEYLSMSIKVKNSSKLNFSTVPVIYDAPWIALSDALFVAPVLLRLGYCCGSAKN